jgi:hypothetical protein
MSIISAVAPFGIVRELPCKDAELMMDWQLLNVGPHKADESIFVAPIGVVKIALEH